MFDNVAQDTTETERQDVKPRLKVIVLFGTRPEIIKLSPVIHEIAQKIA